MLQCPLYDQYNRAMLTHQRIALIGAGNMAEAILASVLYDGQLRRFRIFDEQDGDVFPGHED
jgi:NADH/NAD ratio-sensing transcriptional regulator Rex